MASSRALARVRAGSTRRPRPTSTGSQTCSLCWRGSPTSRRATSCGSQAAAARPRPRRRQRQVTDAVGPGGADSSQERKAVYAGALSASPKVSPLWRQSMRTASLMTSGPSPVATGRAADTSRSARSHVCLGPQGDAAEGIPLDDTIAEPHEARAPGAGTVSLNSTHREQLGRGRWPSATTHHEQDVGGNQGDKQAHRDLDGKDEVRHERIRSTTRVCDVDGVGDDRDAVVVDRQEAVADGRPDGHPRQRE
jgi:hypothetical protein